MADEPFTAADVLRAARAYDAALEEAVRYSNDMERELQAHIDRWTLTNPTPCGECGWHLDYVRPDDGAVALSSCCAMHESGPYENGEVEVPLHELFEIEASDV